MGKEERRVVAVPHVVHVNWGRCGAGAQGGLAKTSPNQGARQYFGAAPIQVDDASASDTSTALTSC